MEKVVSIYYDIEENFLLKPYYPYLFQDSDDGILEASIVIYPNEMTLNKKYTLANQLFLYLQDSIELNKPTRELIELLEKYCLLNYAEQFVEILRFNSIKDDQGYLQYAKIGYTLATMMTYKELVKLGMLLLGLDENEENLKVLMTLGAHSEYTAYAIEALRYSMNRNDFIRDLIGKTGGYGRICALNYYVVMDYDSAIYLMEHAKNDKLPCYAAYVILDKIVCEEYFEKINLNKYNYSKYSHLLAHGLIDHSFEEFPHIVPLISKFIYEGEALATSFLDYCAILVCMECLKNNKKDSLLIKKCENLLSNPVFNELTISAMEDYTGKVELLLQAVKYLKLEVPFSVIRSLFSQAPIVLSNYMFKEHKGMYEDLAADELLPTISFKTRGNGWINKSKLNNEEYFLDLLVTNCGSRRLDVLSIAIHAENKLLRQKALSIIEHEVILNKEIVAMLEKQIENELNSTLKKKMNILIKQASEN